MSSSHVKNIHQLNHDAYNEHTHHYLREITSDSPAEATEVLNDLETTDEPIGMTDIEESTTAIETTFGQESEYEGITSYTTTTKLTTLQEAASSDSSSESSQTILIVLGILLAILLIVCCVLACIFARMRRKGFCTVEGKNQETCDEDCERDAMSLQQSPKESMSSGKSSDKLLTK